MNTVHCSNTDTLLGALLPSQHTPSPSDFRLLTSKSEIHPPSLIPQIVMPTKTQSSHVTVGTSNNHQPPTTKTLNIPIIKRIQEATNNLRKGHHLWKQQSECEKLFGQYIPANVREKLPFHIGRGFTIDIYIHTFI